MKAEFTNFYEEHKKLYQELDARLKELSKNKKEINRNHLILEVEKLIEYVESLLEEHFKEEEKIFEKIKIPEEVEDLFRRILNDHKEIREKHLRIKENFENILKANEKDKLELQKQLLFPSYNLIATINHHAQREDQFFQT